MRLAVLDLPEGNAMRAPGEAPGLMALEIAMDEMAEKLRTRPDRVSHPQRHAGRSRRSRSGRSRSANSSSACSIGAERFGWTARNRRPARCATAAGWSAWASAAALPQQPAARSRARACGSTVAAS